MLRRWLAAWTIGAALACAAPLGAQDLTLEQQFERVAGLRPEVATAFFDALRRNVGRDERAAACAMVAYPLEQPSGPVPDAAACVKAYDQIFTIAVRRAIGRQAFDQVLDRKSTRLNSSH